ncbi:MAG: mannan endo,4-beta-mannosidase [Actinomycetota bacterium]|jgi:hypothetical protein
MRTFVRFCQLVTIVTVLLLTIGPAPVSRASVGTTLLGVRAPNPSDPYSLSALRTWQGGKTDAVALFFRKADYPATGVVSALSSLWKSGRVPMYSVEMTSSNAAVAKGLLDLKLDATASAIRSWLAGPDHRYGNADDRRAYIRPAWEPNGNWYGWSPCSLGGGTADDYKAMWRHVHDRYDRAGIDSAHLAWVFSVNQADWADRCKAEALYPGDAYVDWTGIDGYTRSINATPASVFAPMVARLRAMAPKKPVSVNEAGAATAALIGKSAYITAYFDWLAANDIRMAIWFNLDRATTRQNWAVFGGSSGDETFTDGLKTYRAWRAYRVGIASTTIVGSDAANPRLLTDAQFLGH